ncbi:hypothetical protein A5893_09235 [Pedobacter psychrophilus]|uniref:DUF2490 domain-containing protein n=1 Tax=Pedobacter psychrophilus TaxID=1826909 RepID=A0A179DFT3_9SPHI|nr:DUF2490 domain-containing protein [Pedobacter psychrophilus]OAQ39754.1 hypothetical protein A5893_09235 [Pedobacter psychrophilus]
MKFSLKYILLSVFILITTISKAQNISQNSGWAASINSFKISEKTGIHFDVQFRSADNLDYLRNVLIRPGFTYFFDKTKNATVGYAFILTNQGNSFNNDLIEHRIWEQFIYNIPIVKNVQLTNRLRLEQRFIEQNIDDVFSQRIRYFFRSVVPLQKNENNFTKGAFLALQNEIFINLQNKEKLNNHSFDQNRAYLAAGYRLNTKIDFELGYLNQYSKGTANSTTNNIFQVAVYSRF